MQNHSSFIQAFKNAIKKKEQTFICPRSQSILIYLFFLQKNLLIRRITFTHKTYVLVELKYSKFKQSLIKDIMIKSVKEQHFVNCAWLRNFSHKHTNSILIISTVRGFLTHKQALFHNLGGVLIAKITV